MKTFVTNLERSAIRRSHMERQLNEQGIDFEFIKAIDGATLTDDYLAEICDFEQLSKRPYLLTKGTYGCLLSHYKTYKKIVEENIPFALILEDDVNLQSSLKNILLEIESKIQKNEAILLFSQNNYMKTIFSDKDSDTILNTHKISYPMDPWALGSAAGYIITKQAAQCMLDFLLPIRCAADTWGIFYEQNVICSLRCVTPFLVKPAGFKSDIDYIDNVGLIGKVLKYINQYNLFPFKQILDYRRKSLLNKTILYSFTSEKSPIASKITNEGMKLQK